jgi:hypothetical protein
VADSRSASRRAERAARRRVRRGRLYWTSAEILDAIRRWHDLYGEPPSMADWEPYRARVIGQPWRIERYESGDWPSSRSVRNHFGRLSDAVALAGLVPRTQGQQRPRAELALDADVLLHLAHMRALRKQRATPSDLADAVREVATARASPDPEDLRASLVDLAAIALAWATTATTP